MVRVSFLVARGSGPDVTHNIAVGERGLGLGWLAERM
jgi:hypothetical protein